MCDPETLRKIAKMDEPGHEDMLGYPVLVASSPLCNEPACGPQSIGRHTQADHEPKPPERTVTITMSRDEAFDLRMELIGALSFLEKDDRIEPGDGARTRKLIKALEAAWHA